MEIPHPTFRPLRPEDRESIARAADNLRIWNCVRDHLPHPYTLADADAFIAGSMAQEPPTDFAIDIGGQAAGVIGMVRGSDVQRISAEVGFWLGEEFWGCGIASRVVSDFVKYVSPRQTSSSFSPRFSVLTTPRCGCSKRQDSPRRVCSTRPP